VGVFSEHSVVYSLV